MALCDMCDGNLEAEYEYDMCPKCLDFIRAALKEPAKPLTDKFWDELEDENV